MWWVRIPQTSRKFSAEMKLDPNDLKNFDVTFAPPVSTYHDKTPSRKVESSNPPFSVTAGECAKCAIDC